MYCELTKKDVQITKCSGAEGGNLKIEFSECSNSFIIMDGKKFNRPCGMRHDEKCLLRNFK